MLALAACGGAVEAERPSAARPTTTDHRSGGPAGPTTSERSGSGTSSTSTTSTTTTTVAPPSSVAPGWRADLAAVRVQEEGPDEGYDRDLFEHWIDADDDGCSTRCEVLLREFRQDLPDAPQGGWRSVYDGVVTGESSELDVDHTVALAEAWRSGASSWSEPRRRDFANDLAPGALRAVTASVNRSKGDRDPSEWQPPDRSSWCTYASDWLSTKVRWGLSADPAEFTNLATMLDGCP